MGIIDEMEIEKKATLNLRCPRCGTQWTIPLGTEELMLEQELVTVRIDEEKRLNDLVNGVWDEPGAVRERRITLTATAEGTLWGLTCACLGI